MILKWQENGAERVRRQVAEKERNHAEEGEINGRTSGSLSRRSSSVNGFENGTIRDGQRGMTKRSEKNLLVELKNRINPNGKRRKEVFAAGQSRTKGREKKERGGICVLTSGLKHPVRRVRRSRRMDHRRYCQSLPSEQRLSCEIGISQGSPEL